MLQLKALRCDVFVGVQHAYVYIAFVLVCLWLVFVGV